MKTRSFITAITIFFPFLLFAQKIDCQNTYQYFIDQQKLSNSIRLGSDSIIKTISQGRISNDECHFSILVGVTSETSNHYGGVDILQDLVKNQFDRVNSKFNAPGVFDSTFNFSVDSLYVFSGNVDTEIFKSFSNFDYKVIIDGYPAHGGGWYGSYNTIYHSWPIRSYGGPFDDTATDGLIHEWGHSRGAIDLYALKVDGTNNPINNEDYQIPFNSIMNYPYGVDVWDELSINLININAGQVITDLNYIHDSFPSKIIIKTTDQSGVPLENTTITLYPVKWYSNSVLLDPSLSLNTNIIGNAELLENPFHPGNSNEPWRIEYCNFLIEVMHEGIKYFEWMPIYEVLNHYFRSPNATYTKTIELPLISETISPIPYSYTSFQGDEYDLFLWEGENLVLLTKSNALDHKVMNDIISTLDNAYEFYENFTGRKPIPFFQYNDKTTIAQVRETCGAGCAYLGNTGIEIQDYYFSLLYDNVLESKKYDQIPFYELGRNFWFYGDKIEMGSSTTGYAVFMRFLSMNAAGVEGAKFNEYEFKDLENEVKNLFNLYINDPALNWENTIKIGKAPSNIMGLGGSDLFASFMFKLSELYGSSFITRFWKEVEKRPNAANEYQAADNFILAASITASQNLVPLFQQWRWPVSQDAINEANLLFGNDRFIAVHAKGTKAYDSYAHFSVVADNQEIGDIYATSDFTTYSFQLTSDQSTLRFIHVVFDNDTSINGENRNLFVDWIVFNGDTIRTEEPNVFYLKTDGTFNSYSGIMESNGTLLFDLDFIPKDCSQDVSLVTQYEVNTFSCSEVHGHLRISGSDIKNLDGLRQLKSIDGGLIIQNNNSLEDISGLKSLEKVGMGLHIRDNNILENLNGLDGLKSIGWDLIIWGNDALKNINGIHNLSEGILSIRIEGNFSLENVDGLSSLTTLPWDLLIIDNRSLSNLNGLSNLASIGFSLRIENNEALVNLDGLISLNTIGIGWNNSIGLSLINNHSLLNLDGLSNLTKIEGDLTIKENFSLENLDGLSALKSAGSNLWIENNANLNRCCGLYPLLSEGAIGGIAEIDDGAGCTETDILQGGYCSPCYYIQDLITDEVLNKGQANALMKKLLWVNKINQYSHRHRHSYKFSRDPWNDRVTAFLLRAFNNQVDAFVRCGKLSPAQGQTLTLLASLSQDCDYGCGQNNNLRIEEPLADNITLEEIMEYELRQNYPNPVRDRTYVPFLIPESTHVLLKLTDEMGRDVDILLNENVSLGYHEVEINTSSLTDGIYFYTLQTEKFQRTLPMVIKK